MKKDVVIKAVLFDLDDTLVNSNQAEFNAICEFKRLYNEFVHIEDNEFAKQWKKIAEKEYKKYFRGEISFERQRIERMKELFKCISKNISDEEAKKIFNWYLKSYEKNWRLFDDAEYILNYLKSKYKLAIISNGDGEQQRRKIKYTKLEKYFSDIFISSEVGHTKPGKEIFEIADKTINVAPENCVMIGDKLKVDIEGSLNAGMNAIWINRKNEKSDYKFQIGELKELEKFL